MNNQNTKKLRRSLAVLVGFAATLSASAQVIFSDSSPTIGVGEWSLRATDAKTSFTTTTDSLTGGQALALAYSGTVTSATQSTLIGRSFTETTLTAGQTLRFQFDFHPTAGTSTILRFGLFDGTAAISGSGFTGYDTAGGYYALIRNNSGSGNFIRRQNPGLAVPTDSTNGTYYAQLGTNATNYTWDTLTAYTVTFDVLYNSATSGTVTTSIFDLGTSIVRYSLTGNWTSAGISTFDGAFIRLDQSGSNAVSFDNLSVSLLSSIPEPATYAVWLGLVALGLTGYRRFKRV